MNNDQADREAFRKKIDAHRAAGTCYICSKPVTQGQAIHGLTGAHWDCNAWQEREAEAAVIRLERALKKT